MEETPANITIGQKIGADRNTMTCEKSRQR